MHAPIEAGHARRAPTEMLLHDKHPIGARALRHDAYVDQNNEKPGAFEMHEDDHSGNALARDLKLIVDRRQILRWLAASSLVPFAGCVTKSASLDPGSTRADAGTSSGSDGGSASSLTSSDAASRSSSAGTCSAIPEETAGPYPGDGSNGPNVLALSGIVRSDITASIGSASGVATGVPLTIKLKLVDASGCAVQPGHAVYVWHCTSDGSYSMYSGAAQNENYLRGVQEVGDDGVVSFKSIFPGCYSGRWPHIHFEVYESLDAATAGSNMVATSQLAMPKAACDQAYTSAGYAASVRNLAMISLQTDNVFGDDGAKLQLATVTGSVDAGYTAELTVAIQA
jgi:protocatechuate 3,4-dioxygenase beta subunit